MRTSNFIPAIVILLVLAACGAGAATPTPLPSLTPFSTPLPWLSTPVPAGTAANPLRLAVVVSDIEAANTFESRLEAALQVGGLVVDVVPVENDAEALEVLCSATGPDDAAAAWLDGFGYAAARSQQCGEALLMLQSERTGQLRFGERSQFILNSELDNDLAGAIEGGTICRISADDSVSWMMPTLQLRVRNIDLAGIGTLREYPDYDALVVAVAEGECDGAGVPRSLLLDLAEAGDSRMDQVEAVQLSAPIPYGVLVVSGALPENRRAALGSAHLEPNFEPVDESESALMTEFLGEYAIVAPESEVLAEFVTFITETGFDLAELGR